MDPDLRFVTSRKKEPVLSVTGAQTTVIQDKNVSSLRHIKSAMGFLGRTVYNLACGTKKVSIKEVVFERELKNW